jgi:hypothetical protein
MVGRRKRGSRDKIIVVKGTIKKIRKLQIKRKDPKCQEK